MSKRQTDFVLEETASPLGKSGLMDSQARVRIIGKAPYDSPYVAIETPFRTYFIKDSDLKRLATNILKSLHP